MGQDTSSARAGWKVVTVCHCCFLHLSVWPGTKTGSSNEENCIFLQGWVAKDSTLILLIDHSRLLSEGLSPYRNRCQSIW